MASICLRPVYGGVDIHNMEWKVKTAKQIAKKEGFGGTSYDYELGEPLLAPVADKMVSRIRLAAGWGLLMPTIDEVFAILEDDTVELIMQLKQSGDPYIDEKQLIQLMGYEVVE